MPQGTDLRTTQGRFQQRLEEHMPLLRDIVKDEKGHETSIVMGSCTTLAVTRYVLQNDIDSFRSYLTKAAQLSLDLIRRFQEGKPISESYVTILSYKNLFGCLAAGSIDVSRELALWLLKRDPEAEKKFVHHFDIGLGFCLAAFVLKDEMRMKQWASGFAKECQKKGAATFLGYSAVFDAILESNLVGAQEGIERIAHDHNRLAKGLFRYTEQEHLCVWGVGMAHLARCFDLEVTGAPPQIPNDLLVSASVRRAGNPGL
jgi:hypothetical protein